MGYRDRRVRLERVNAWTVRARAERQEWLDNLKLAAGCADCGYNAHPRALDFDHIGTDKAGDVSRMAHSTASWARLKAEIAKCEVVCANCHRIRTFTRRQMALPIAPVSDEPLFSMEEVA